MPFNGNGTFVLPDPPLEAGEIVSADEHNTTRDDMATGFTNCVTRDGQSPAVANLPMGTYKHTNVGASNSLTNYARTDQVQNSSFNWLTSVSGSNTITAASAVAPAAYAAGQRFAFIPSAVNTDPVTININSLGAKSIKINGQDNLYAGFLNPGTVYTIVYDGTAFQVALANNSGVFYVERFSGDGSETEFTLTRSAINKNYLLVYIYGVYQQKDTYSFSGTTLTFDTAPPLGTDNIEVVISSTLAIGETDASAVSYTLPTTGAVTTNVEAKLAQTVSLADFGSTTYHTVRIPTDYSTMQDAFTALAPGVCKSGQYFNILIEAGHQITRGLSLKFGDYSHFRISSEDSTVTLASGFVFAGISNSVLDFQQCHAPDVNILVDAGGLGGNIFNYQEARGKVWQDKGAINGGNTNLYINSGSIVNAFRTVWNGAGNVGCWVSRTSFFDAEESQFSDSGNIGITVRRGSRANITNSHINNNANAGLSCTRSYVNFQGREDAGGPLLAQCNNNGSNGVQAVRGSQVTITGLQANGNTDAAVYVTSGSIADFDNAEAKNNNIGVRALYGGIVSCAGSTITNNVTNISASGAASSVDASGATLSSATETIIFATDGAQVSAADATGTGAGTNAVEARDGAMVSIPDATFTGAGTYGIVCYDAIVSAPRANVSGAGTSGIRALSSTVYFREGNAQKTPGTPTTSDINFTEGSIIHAYNALGGYSALVTPNTISGNRGILFGA